MYNIQRQKDETVSFPELFVKFNLTSEIDISMDV